MKHVWNNEQLMNNKNEIQKSLIHHIVDDRLQEGALVTDLIDSIKSPYTTPQQLVSKSLISIVLINYYVNCFRRHREYWRRKIFEKESELLKLSVEMREKSDEITHLKTHEVSLIDKSDTLEKGQSIYIIYYMGF